MREQRIDSPGNARLKRYRRLGDAGGRDEAGLVPAEGLRLVLEVLESALPVPELLVSDGMDPGRARRVMEAAEARGEGRGPLLLRLPEQVFRRISHTRSPQGVAAVVARPSWPPLDEVLGSTDRVVVLHRPQDPGNTGSVIRSSEAAGAGAVILVGPACDPWNPKAVRASMGSVFRLPVLVAADFPAVARALRDRGCRILAADPRARRSLYRLPLEPPVAFLFGGETGGLPADGDVPMTRFSLPMAGRVESLNLAQAVTAVLFEMVRRTDAAG